jgi:hypothetical protein
VGLIEFVSVFFRIRQIKREDLTDLVFGPSRFVAAFLLLEVGGGEVKI